MYDIPWNEEVDNLKYFYFNHYTNNFIVLQDFDLHLFL